LTEREQWTWVIRVALAKKLITQDEVHVDDIDVSDVPQQHRNLIGQTFKRFLDKKWMEPTGERRASKRRSTHGRRSDVYAVTTAGRKVFAGREGNVDVASPAPSRRATPLARAAGSTSPTQQASRGVRPSSPAPRPPAARLPKTHDPAVRAAREDALMDRVDHFVATTTGASAWWEQQELAAA
jgi:hypothetical protein